MVVVLVCWPLRIQQLTPAPRCQVVALRLVLIVACWFLRRSTHYPSWPASEASHPCFNKSMCAEHVIRMPSVVQMPVRG